jgi:hypothetical protein
MPKRKRECEWWALFPGLLEQVSDYLSVPDVLTGAIVLCRSLRRSFDVDKWLTRNISRCPANYAIVIIHHFLRGDYQHWLMNYMLVSDYYPVWLMKCVRVHEPFVLDFIEKFVPVGYTDARGRQWMRVCARLQLVDCTKRLMWRMQVSDFDLQQVVSELLTARDFSACDFLWQFVRGETDVAKAARWTRKGMLRMALGESLDNQAAAEWLMKRKVGGSVDYRFKFLIDPVCVAFGRNLRQCPLCNSRQVSYSEHPSCHVCFVPFSLEA